MDHTVCIVVMLKHPWMGTRDSESKHPDQVHLLIINDNNVNGLC